MRRRIAFIDYFPPHYRQRLYETIAQRMEADFYFFSDEKERWHNKQITAVREGDYRAPEMKRVRIAGQAVLPGMVTELSPRRYDAVVKSLNGKLMLPLTYGTARRRGVPFVLWTGMWHHPTTLAHRASRPMTERIYRGADAIVCYGEHVQRFVREHRGVDPAKVFVAGQAVDGRRFEAVEPERNGNGHADLVFVGQFKPYKGIETLLDAFTAVADTGARLKVVGNGPLEPLIRERAARQPGIELVGHVPQDELPHVLASARAAVLPSVTTELDREPWGLVVNEAMHAGLPVVASDAVGAAAGGLVQDGRNGFVVPERDARALATAMRRVIDDAELAGRLGDQARVDVKAFNYDRMADGFEQAVEHAIAARRR